ncbi:Uncharacterised protein [Cedecea lapagei]|uniref:Uncharacterized protein n=1 Tax=Cedecea lapagei TaxID=158823 RepID=A0A3S4IGY9_9ENTR|nr:hypothetical protein [Cedecea lapagei]VEC01336.1 Uncharacterised protein [Cedecea lapagei]
MATTLAQTHPLLAFPFNAAMDFTVYAEHCENFAETLIENDDPALKMALCGRLHACLTLLQPRLLDPIPAHLMKSLTVDTLPASSPRFEPDCTDLCCHCLALTQTLVGQGFSTETEKQLSYLLYDLINYFAAEMKAPRWLRSADGVKFIARIAI